MLIFSGILLGMVSSIIMQTILATVLPTVAEDLGGSHLYSWVFSSYLIVSTVTIPIFAKLADIYGRKGFYLGGMVIFLTGSVLGGISDSMGQLVFFRMIQGLGAGAVAPAAIAMISDLFPVKDRGKAMGMMAVVQVLANVLGPLAGGLIADRLGWQWAFWANIPAGVFAVIFVAVKFAEPLRVNNKTTPMQTDFIGGLLLGAATALAIQGFKIMEEQGLFHIQTGLIIFIAVVFFGLFLRQEKNHPDPVVSSDLILIKNVKVSLVSIFLSGAVMYGNIVILPVYGQMLLGETAFQGGKLLLLLSLGLGIGGVSSGKLIQTFSYASFAVSGWVVVSAGFFLLALSCGLSLGLYFISAAVIVIGIGLGAMFPAFLLSGQNAAAENQRAVVGGLIQMGRNMGGAVGIPFFLGFIVPTGSGLAGFKETDAYLPLFLLLAAVSLAGAAIGRCFKGSLYKDQCAEEKVESKVLTSGVS